MLRSILAAAVLLATSAMSHGAYASPITTLYNTGVDGAGNALPGGNGVIDPHYTIASSTIGATVGANAVTYFNPAYVPDSPTSRWVSNSADGNPGNGTVTFETTFDLTGFDPSTASISGLWGVDNIGEIFLNGNDTGIGLPFGYDAFQALHAFSITTGFMAGLNTLSFVITDSGPPLAFRVESINGNADPVPEPSALFLIIAGVFSLSVFELRRRAGV